MPSFISIAWFTSGWILGCCGMGIGHELKWKNVRRKEKEKAKDEGVFINYLKLSKKS